MEPLETSPAGSDNGALDREPVIIFLTGLAGVVDLGLIAADALDWVNLADNQTAAVIAFITAVTALIAAVLRGKVYAPATVARLTRAV